MRKRLRENYEDFVIKNGVLKEYRGMGTDVVVPDDVVAIGAFAFSRTGVQRLTMPSVKDIDDLAFFECFSLARVIMPAVKTIGKQSFEDCRGLMSVVMPEVESIDKSAFSGCFKLGYHGEIEMPKIMSIGDYAFSNCLSLDKIEINGSVRIGKGAFRGTPVEESIKAQLDWFTESLDGDKDSGLSFPEQEFSSKRTSINKSKLPAIFHMVRFEPGTVNLDYGGGKYDNATEYLAEQGVTNLIFDLYNRTQEHNNEVVRECKAHPADTCTCSNVLNVIKERDVRISVLENISKLVKQGGKVYITVHEGTKGQSEGPTALGYQLARKTESYLDEIQEVFPDAQRKGKLIVATNRRGSKTESCLMRENDETDAASEVEKMLRSMVKKYDGILQYGASFGEDEKQFMVAFDDETGKWIALDDNNEMIGDTEEDNLEDFIKELLDREQ